MDPEAASPEHAMQALALSLVATGLAHDVRNPLNAASLHIALLGDKLAAAGRGPEDACRPHLESLRSQIARVEQLLRRFADVADPPSAGGFDAGALLADALGLCGHEALRRRLALACDAGGPAVRVEASPARVARLVLGLVFRAVTEAPEGTGISARARSEAAEAILEIDHVRATAAGPLAWIGEAVGSAARELGGRLEERPVEGAWRTTLRLPRGRTA